MILPPGTSLFLLYFQFSPTQDLSICCPLWLNCDFFEESFLDAGTRGEILLLAIYTHFIWDISFANTCNNLQVIVCVCDVLVPVSSSGAVLPNLVDASHLWPFKLVEIK